MVSCEAPTSWLKCDVFAISFRGVKHCVHSARSMPGKGLKVLEPWERAQPHSLPQIPEPQQHTRATPMCRFLVLFRALYSAGVVLPHVPILEAHSTLRPTVGNGHLACGLGGSSRRLLKFEVHNTVAISEIRDHDTGK